MTEDNFSALRQLFLSGNITGAALMDLIAQLHHFQSALIAAQDQDAAVAASGLITHASWAADRCTGSEDAGNVSQ